MDAILSFISSMQYFASSGIVIAATAACLFLGLLLARTLFVISRSIAEPRQYFEVIPPAHAMIQAETTAQLFKVLHGIGQTRSMLDRVIDYQPRISLEIVATKGAGIRYIIGCPVSLASMVTQEFKSYMSNARINEVRDPYTILPSDGTFQPMEFRQSRHFALPLTPQNQLDSHDPLAYLTGNMAGLSDDETIIYQLVITPRQILEARSLANKILTNDEVLTRLMGGTRNSLQPLTTSMNALLFTVIDSVGSLTAQGSRVQSSWQLDPLASHRRQVAEHLKPSRVLSSFEQEAVEAIHYKLSEPLFQTSLRTLVSSRSGKEAKERSRRLRTSLTSFSTTQYQSIVSRSNLLRMIRYPYRIFLQRRRLPSMSRRSSLLLSTSEVADLFHFPYSSTNKTEDIVKSLSRTLPAPLSLKNNPTLDVLIGENLFHGMTTSIGLTDKERERHMYVIGGTGNGKTTMLQYMIIQDIKNGKGVAVIDPHGDMAQELLTHIPDERIKDVVYFNPDDLAHPIGLNLLELDPLLTGDDLIREKDLITESVVSIFRKIFSDDGSGGHRVEYVLRNAVQTALTIPEATLFTIYDLLNDVEYLKGVLKTLKDDDLKHFWKNELGKAGDMQKVKMAAGITAKVGRFLFSASAKRILEQPKSTIDFEEIINSGKILICNFSKGLIGEDTSELFGITVLAKLQLASLKRARSSQLERRPYYLYVDEFQNFATVSFVQMLSEARKYKLLLVMAEQSTSQQDDPNMVNMILANVGTAVSFRTGNPADEQALLPLFRPYIEPGEIANLPSYHFYMRLAAIHSQEPLSGMTVVCQPERRDVNTIIQQSRATYAKKYASRDRRASSSEIKTETADHKTERAITTARPKPTSNNKLSSRPVKAQARVRR